MSPRLILASASPQRKNLMRHLDVEFDVIPSDVDEPSCPETDPANRSQILAQWKAKDVADKHADAYVIGCDTLVVGHDGSLLEKPCDRDEAQHMLELHSGQTSIVHSGLCVIGPDGSMKERLQSSSVTFGTLSENEIQWWLDTNLWQGRSGGFQIDGPGQFMIERIDGDWTSIVGLPMYDLVHALEELGYPLRS